MYSNRADGIKKLNLSRNQKEYLWFIGGKIRSHYYKS